MYLLYLVAAIALSTGFGALTQYNVSTQNRDDMNHSRVSVHIDQQEIVSRSLRRQLLINPTQFPSVGPGQYAEIDQDFVRSSMPKGYIHLENTKYYLNDFGHIFAILQDGPAAPGGVNGDPSLGVTSPPQDIDRILTDIFGDNYQRGPLPNRSGGQNGTSG